ncbi:LAME_0G14158g1_1 [Lachancea meyersii CBS 8951]|uniref:LAME_0G14158g1_1 n=1 Tax=Lachancea meyersii CBS 8951 TaxID=1266667 RepID=A0A1G4KA98_9SACH|nr:LAME_0G14158g1_1 [Lachancea meyersii CBS 8951]
MPVIQHEEHEFHLSHEQETKLNEFQMITSFPDEELALVVKLLENHGWLLESALGRYFDGNWQEDLNPPAIAERPPTPTPQGFVSHSASPFLLGDNASFVPRLPLVKRLPLDFKDNFRLVGLDRRPENNFNNHPALLILLFLPKVLLKIGTGLITILWSIISFGFKNDPVAEKQIKRIPRRPNEKSTPAIEIIESLLGKNSELASLLNPKPFNEIYDECENDFKMMMVVCLGDLESEELGQRDENSMKFVTEILNNPSTLQLLREHSDNLRIYMQSAQSPEMWAVANQLKIRYTPECLLIANVLNSRDSVNGVTRMSVIGRIKVSSLRRFQNAFKVTTEKHSAELLVSRNDQKELKLAREIKELQDQAYQESLRQDQLKQRMRQEENETARKSVENERHKALQKKIERAERELRALDVCLGFADGQRSVNLEAGKATLQIRTSTGKRLVRVFAGDESLKDIYLTVKCFLSLDLKSFEDHAVLESVKTKLDTLLEDGNVLNLDETHWSQEALAGESLGSLKMRINQKLETLCESNREVELDINFELVSPFPRFRVPCDGTVNIKDTSQIWPNGSLLVETIEDEDVTEM